MSIFTLELSKQAMLVLQLNLPKGFSLVKTAKDSKKSVKPIKNTDTVDNSAENDDLSEEFAPKKSQSKVKTHKSPAPKSKNQKVFESVKDSKPQIIESKPEQKVEKVIKKDSRKLSSEESDVFDSDSEERTTSEPKIKSKKNVKQNKAEKKGNLRDSGHKNQEAKKETLNSKNSQQKKTESTNRKDTKIKVSKNVEEQAFNQSKDESTLEKQPDTKEFADKDPPQKKTEANKKDEKMKSNPKPKSYNHEMRLQIIKRIRKLDKSTLEDFFKAISFSKGEILDFKLMEDEKIRVIEAELIKFEEIHKEKIRMEIQKQKAKNPKSLEDFEVAEDKDYQD